MKPQNRIARKEVCSGKDAKISEDLLIVSIVPTPPGLKVGTVVQRHPARLSASAVRLCVVIAKWAFLIIVHGPISAHAGQTTIH